MVPKDKTKRFILIYGKFKHFYETRFVTYVIDKNQHLTLDHSYCSPHLLDFVCHIFSFRLFLVKFFCSTFRLHNSYFTFFSPTILCYCSQFFLNTYIIYISIIVGYPLPLFLMCDCLQK